MFRDANGDVVGIADVKLPTTLPVADGTFKGNWKLLYFKPAFPSSATTSGSYSGSVHGGWASIDLNPGMADDNVVLNWLAGTDPITGVWYHTTFSGGKPMGTFALNRYGKGAG